jgi:hypothetical protein
MDLSTAADARLRSGHQRDRFHLLQFSDANAKELYACCLVVTEALEAPNVAVLDNMRYLLFMRRSARRIERFMRYILRCVRAYVPV